MPENEYRMSMIRVIRLCRLMPSFLANKDLRTQHEWAKTWHKMVVESFHLRWTIFSHF